MTAPALETVAWTDLTPVCEGSHECDNPAKFVMRFHPGEEVPCAVRLVCGPCMTTIMKRFERAFLRSWTICCGGCGNSYSGCAENFVEVTPL